MVSLGPISTANVSPLQRLLFLSLPLCAEQGWIPLYGEARLSHDESSDS